MFFTVNLWDDLSLDIYSNSCVPARNVDNELLRYACTIACTSANSALDAKHEIAADEPVLAAIVAHSNMSDDGVQQLKARWMRMQNLLELLVVHEHEPFIERCSLAVDEQYFPSDTDTERPIIDLGDLREQKAALEQEAAADSAEEHDQYDEVSGEHAESSAQEKGGEDASAVSQAGVSEEGEEDAEPKYPWEMKYGYFVEHYKGLMAEVPIVSLPEAIPLSLEVVYHKTVHAPMDESVEQDSSEQAAQAAA
jgi:hypothetical protein